MKQFPLPELLLKKKYRVIRGTKYLKRNMEFNDDFSFRAFLVFWCNYIFTKDLVFKRPTKYWKYFRLYSGSYRRRHDIPPLLFIKTIKLIYKKVDQNHLDCDDFYCYYCYGQPAAVVAVATWSCQHDTWSGHSIANQNQS